MKKRKARIRHEKEVVEINHETGRVTKQRYETIKTAESEPPFVKVYIDDISRLYEIPKGANDLIYSLLKRMDYDGYIALNKAYKEIICKDLNIKDQTLRNYLTKLSKKNILRIVGKGLYQMSPDLFAKGSWLEIQKRRDNFRLIINYDYNGTRQIVGESVRSA